MGIRTLVNNFEQVLAEGEQRVANKKLRQALNIPQDENGITYDIGNISDHHIQIPPRVPNNWITYNGDPNDFDFEAKAKYKRPPITYKSKIAQFGLKFRIRDGALLRRGTQTQLDYEIDQDSRPAPWVTVIVNSGDQYPRTSKKELLNIYLKRYTQPASLPPLTYSGHEMGLDVYRFFGGSKPPPQNSWDKAEVYIQGNPNGEITTFIKCTNNPDFAFNSCRHSFFMPDNRIKVFFEMGYPRAFLSDWQQIEKHATHIMSSFVVDDTQTHERSE